MSTPFLEFPTVEEIKNSEKYIQKLRMIEVLLKKLNYAINDGGNRFYLSVALYEKMFDIKKMKTFLRNRGYIVKKISFIEPGCGEKSVHFEVSWK